MRIPDGSAWRGYENDLDVKYLHRLFFGKSSAEVQEHFGRGRSIERMDELLYAPRLVFQYYVHAFASFVMSDKAKGDPDSASSFLSLLEAREEREAGSVRQIYASLAHCIDFVANNQVHFKAGLEIYGDFEERAQRIRALCGMGSAC